MAKNHKILVPISIKEESFITLKQAQFFHDIFDLDITVINVIPSESFFEKTFKNDENKISKDVINKQLIKNVSEQYDGKIPDYIKIKIVEGDLLKTILKYSEKKNYDLIIIKKEKTNNSFDFYKQSFVDEIIASSFCPVITIKETLSVSGIKLILLPLDITQKTKKKLNWAYILAKKFDAKVLLVSALNVPIYKENSLAYQKAEKIKEFFSLKNIECEYEILEAFDKEPHEVVLDFIKQKNPDLVMTMTHKENFTFNKTIGHFSTELIHECETPIFTFIPQPDTIMNKFMGVLRINS